MYFSFEVYILYHILTECNTNLPRLLRVCIQLVLLAPNQSGSGSSSIGSDMLVLYSSHPGSQKDTCVHHIIHCSGYKL
jgi:hypothetical protein